MGGLEQKMKRKTRRWSVRVLRAAEKPEWEMISIHETYCNELLDESNYLLTSGQHVCSLVFTAFSFGLLYETSI